MDVEIEDFDADGDAPVHVNIGKNRRGNFRAKKKGSDKPEVTGEQADVEKGSTCKTEHDRREGIEYC